MPPTMTPSPQLDLVYFGLFDNCNARCNMCDCWLLPRAQLDLSHYRRMLDATLDLQPRAIRFTGGEPLLLRGLPDLVERAADTGVRVSVISNGRILPSKVTALAESGCHEIVMSIDAMGANHDTIRDTTGLFDRCMTSIARIADTEMNYGVNTVLQSLGVDDLEQVGELLVSQRRPPTWWHIIPIRGNEDIVPDAQQMQRTREAIPRLRERLAGAGIDLIAADDPFQETTGPTPCTVPTFTAYIRADSGEVYGCNMLVYGDAPIANLNDLAPHAAWRTLNALTLRERCAAGRNIGCSRCDVSSRSMNYFLRDLADPALSIGSAR